MEIQQVLHLNITTVEHPIVAWCGARQSFPPAPSTHYLMHTPRPQSSAPYKCIKSSQSSDPVSLVRMENLSRRLKGGILRRAAYCLRRMNVSTCSISEGKGRPVTPLCSIFTASHDATEIVDLLVCGRLRARLT